MPTAGLGRSRVKLVREGPNVGGKGDLRSGRNDRTKAREWTFRNYDAFIGYNHCGLGWEAVDNGVLIFVLGRPGSSLGRAGDDANERVTLGGGSS